jgi:hypothetical protein
MIKVCLSCRSTWAGGQTCEDCGGQLRDTFDGDAGSFPRGIWSYIRLQYGARRGMLVRVMALILGPIAGALLLRAALSLAMPWLLLGMAGAICGGVFTWWAIHWLAGRAVKIWVLRKGQLSKKKLARALFKRKGPRPQASGLRSGKSPKPEV